MIYTVIITAAVLDGGVGGGTTQVQTISTLNYRKYFLRSLLFLDVTQHRLVATDVLRQHMDSIFNCQAVRRQFLLGLLDP
jgi:hypothetical protein